MRQVDLLIVLLSHALASRSFWQSLLRHNIPRTVDFAVISLIFYYDLGLALEAAGYSYQSHYFNSLFQASDGTFLLATTILALAPWLFLAGSFFTSPRDYQQPQAPSTAIEPSRRTAFYLLMVALTVPLALYGALQLLRGDPLWLIRINITASWGPLIIVLYLPLYCLAFYVRQTDAQGWRGTLFAVGLAFATVLATAGIDERTLLLVPFLIIGVFRFRLSLTKLAGGTVVLILLASLLLPLLRAQYAGSQLGAGELVAETISADVSRAGVLSAALELSDPLGTRLMPYPLSGYVYSLLFVVPRSLAPFKGGPTTQYFTAYMAGTPVEDTQWSLGVGAIEELLLNAGTLAVLPGLLIYGLAMGWLDLLSQRAPSLVVPTRLAAVWLCGYNLPAILMLFGVMALVDLALHRLFVERRRRTQDERRRSNDAGLQPDSAPAP